MACRFPGADTLEAFWDLLRHGRDAVTETPADRWKVSSFFDPGLARPGKLSSSRGGFLSCVDRFDPLFFGISPREAGAIDPQHRLLLELAWEALEDGGLVADRLAGSRTGVFVGLSTYDYGLIQLQPGESPLVNPYLMLGSTLSIGANRISHAFDFRGPSLVSDTACSSSLVALHLACRSLWQGESELALVGGANLMLRPINSIAFSNAGMLSPEGRCKSFDAAADGYVRGEGGGVVVLQPLGKALRDNNRVYALVLGSAVNQDGRTPGITVPSARAQHDMLRDAYRDAGVSPGLVQYVEAHGTGTPAGDPVEANALGAVLGAGRPPESPCLLGSVKTNIGHLEAASGVAGVIKTALALYHREVPPSLHFVTPNPRIDFDRLRLSVAVRSRPWPANGRHPRLAGVNSFGFGGTNAHAVLAGWEPGDTATAGPGDDRSTVLLPLSARSPEALAALAANWARWLEERPDLSLRDTASTAGTRRSHHLHRLAVAADDAVQAVHRLRAVGSPHPVGGLSVGRAQPSPQVVFVFTGMGPQWWAMGRELLAQEPIFREAVVGCDRLLGSRADWSLLEELSAEQGRSRIDEPRIAQPALFALQVGLVALWRSWGVAPAAVVGHSVGEVAAAHAAGALSLQDAVGVVFHRSRLQHGLRGQGKMLAVALSEKEARAQIEMKAGGPGTVAVAAVNSPGSVTLSGDARALEEIARGLVALGTFCRFLQGDVPYHSAYMEPLGDELRRSLRDVAPQAPAVPLYSTVTGEPVAGPDLDADYWWRNAREPVWFARAVGALLEAGHEWFLEIGPHPVLAASIKECADALHRPSNMLASLRRREAERHSLLQTLGRLWVQGHPVRWENVNPAGRLADLPPYPWQRDRYWRETEEAGWLRQGHARGTCPGLLGGGEHPLLGRPVRSALAAASTTRTWHVDIDLQVEHPWLADHRIQGAILYPAAAYLETALWALGHTEAGGGEGTPTPFTVGLEQVEFHRPLILSPKRGQPLELLVEDDLGRFSFFAREVDGSWARVATGQAGRAGAPPAVGLDEVRRRCPEEIPGEGWYRQLEQDGYQYGPTMRGVRAVWCGDAEALALVDAPEALAATLGEYAYHPALIDACIQVCLGTFPFPGKRRLDVGTYVPRRADRVCYHRPPGGEGSSGPMWCHVQHARGAQEGLCDIRLFDAEGRALMEVVGLQSVSIGARETEAEGPDAYFHEYRWLLQPREGEFPDGMPPVARILQEAAPAPAETRAAGPGADQEVRTRLNALCADYAREALRGLTLPWRFGRRVSTETLADEGGVVASQRGLFADLLSILAEEGDLRRVEGGWEEGEPIQGGRPEDSWRALLGAAPAWVAELTLLGRTGPDLAAILRGQVDPADLPYPDGARAPALEHLAASGPSAAAGNRLVQAALSALLRLLPEERPLRILEVGAGDLAALLLPLLPRHSSTFLLLVDSSPALAAARQRFGSFPFVECRLIEADPERPCADIDWHAHDVVLTSDLAPPTAGPVQVLPRLARLLAPGGLFLQVLFPRTDRLASLVFAGLSPPRYSLPQWREQLAGAGFSEVGCLEDREAVGPGAGVLLARSPLFRDQGEPRLFPFSLTLAAPLSGLPPAPARAGLWVIFADHGGTATALREQFRRRGERTVLVQPGPFRRLDDEHFQALPDQPEGLHRLLRELPLGTDRLHGIVHLWSLDAEPAGEEPADWPDGAHALGCLSVLHLVQANAAMGWTERPRLYLVTRAAQPVGRGETPAVGQSSLWGLGRSLRVEHPELHCTLIDLGPNSSPEETQSLFDEIVRADIEDEVALRGGDRLVRRLFPVRPDELLVPGRRWGPGSRPFQFVAEVPGLIDSLARRPMRRRPPGVGEIEIEVHAAALNFKDVAKAYNLLGDDSFRDTWSGRLLGLECSGRVTARGEGVTEFHLGDAVVAQAPGCLASHVTVDVRLAAPKPAHLSFEEATTVPVAFVTAEYALFELGRLRAGERVLIHSATGGVGLAAVQLARRAGAEVFATAGHTEKRRFLHLLGVGHVMNSRSLDFAREVLERTGGRGVDVVLNSLAGPALARGLTVLAVGGRFLELGKRDIEQNARLPLLPFHKHAAFFAIDLDRLWAARPALAAESFQRVMRWLRDGSVRPLPYRAFAVAQAQDAFRWMARARHVGKVVLRMAPPSADPPAPRGEGRAGWSGRPRPDATYLITGGLGGFGMATARWLVEQGARRLVLVSLSGAAGAEAGQALQALEQTGAQVLVRQADVCDPDQLAAVLEEVRRTMPPLRGVFHATMFQDEALLLLQDGERFRRVMAPKTAGAVNLHRLTAGDPLDVFVLYSSTTALFGTVGLGSYAAANSFLDCLAHYRRARGLPALSVNWTAVRDVGYVAERPQLGSYMQQLGFPPLPSGVLLDGLSALLEAGAVQTAVVKFDWSQKTTSLLPTTSPTYSRLAPRREAAGAEPGPAGGREALLQLLRATQGEARVELLLARLREQAGKALCISPDSLDPDLPLTSLGLESLMAIDLGNRVRNELGAELPVLKLLGGATLRNLVQDLQEQLGKGG
jgi:acyl transferase domain-containing protein/NADPH:quinone reductase-like Zn-dependent oxidoreductase/acyl carrier protein